MSDVTTTVDTYLSAWNETDPARRATLVEQVWAPDGTLTDPPMAAEGWRSSARSRRSAPRWTSLRPS